MKTILRCFTIAILSACVVTQEIFPCYSNDTLQCKQERWNRCAVSTVGAAVSIIFKVVFWPTSSSPCQTCIAMWCPYNVPCDSASNIIGIVCESTTTGCCLLSATNGTLGLSPCITENHYKKIRKKICCCCPSDSFGCCPEVPTVILNADATRD
jgi:hypothetical protein